MNSVIRIHAMISCNLLQPFAIVFLSDSRDCNCPTYCNCIIYSHIICFNYIFGNMTLCFMKYSIYKEKKKKIEKQGISMDKKQHNMFWLSFTLLKKSYSFHQEK